jgi:Na+/H+ antiporter NhaA
MPRTRIAIRFRIVRDLRAFVIIQVVFETDLAIPALEFVDIVFVIGIFDMEFFTITDRDIWIGSFSTLLWGS